MRACTTDDRAATVRKAKQSKAEAARTAVENSRTPAFIWLLLIGSAAMTSSVNFRNESQSPWLIEPDASSRNMRSDLPAGMHGAAVVTSKPGGDVAYPAAGTLVATGMGCDSMQTRFWIEYSWFLRSAKPSGTLMGGKLSHAFGGGIMVAQKPTSTISTITPCFCAARNESSAAVLLDASPSVSTTIT